MKSKKDFNPLLDCRLVHKDYDLNLNGKQKRDIQQKSKYELIEDFRKNFKLDGDINAFTLKSKDGDEWYYSTTHARGTTMIMFAKWPVGLDCQYNQDVPDNYSTYFASDYFNDSEKEHFIKHNSNIDFLQLWTARESFIKCYFTENQKMPDMNQWKLIKRNNYLAYSNNEIIYQCDKGISDDYTFSICSRE